MYRESSCVSPRNMSVSKALLIILGLASVVISVPQAAQTAWSVGQAVKTSSGDVVGHSAWQPEVSEYLGIPFAQSPVGPLRFAAPKPYSGSGVFNASKFSPDCPANVAAPLGSKIGYESVPDTIKG
jgi:cholinesterase